MQAEFKESEQSNCKNYTQGTKIQSLPFGLQSHQHWTSLPGVQMRALTPDAEGDCVVDCDQSIHNSSIRSG